MAHKDIQQDIHKLPPEAYEELLRNFPDGKAPGKLPPPPPFVDTLSIMTSDFSAKSLISKQSCFTAPWSIEFHGFLCEFCIVQCGSCYAKLIGSDNLITLEEGDLIIFPHQKPYILCDSLTTLPISMFKLLPEKPLNGPPEIHYGGGGTETKVIFGGLLFENDQSRALINALPDYLHLSSKSPS